MKNSKYALRVKINTICCDVFLNKTEIYLKFLKIVLAFSKAVVYNTF